MDRLAVGGVGDAASEAWRAVSKHPPSPGAHYTYAAVLRDSGREHDALTAVNEALHLDPASPDALVVRRDPYRALWGGPTAEPQYLEALRRDPNHALATHNLAVSRMRWGTLGRAIRGLLAAERLDPALRPLVLDNLSVALLRVATASVVFMAVALIVVMAAHDDGLPTATPRIAAGLLAVAFGPVLVWVARIVPWPTLAAVLRHRVMLAVRIGFVALAAVLGMVAAAVGSNLVTDMAGTLLLFGVVGLTLLRLGDRGARSVDYRDPLVRRVSRRQ